jgi:hypothetical protein
MPPRSAFDVTLDDTRRTALADAAKLARASGQLVAWNNSECEYSIALYHEQTHQLQPLTDVQAAILLNRDSTIRRAWWKWNAASNNRGSLLVLDAERVLRVLAASRETNREDDEVDGLA